MTLPRAPTSPSHSQIAIEVPDRRGIVRYISRQIDASYSEIADMNGEKQHMMRDNRDTLILPRS